MCVVFFFPASSRLEGRDVLVEQDQPFDMPMYSDLVDEDGQIF